MSRIAPKPGSYPAPQTDARGDVVSHTLTRVTDSPLDRAVADARIGLRCRVRTRLRRNAAHVPEFP
jgi:hypothetical protein